MVAHRSDPQDLPENAVPRCRTTLRRVDPLMVRQLEKRLSSRKPQHVMEQLGISLNTWSKLLVGEPIRASVAERLLDRFQDLLEFN